MCTKTDFETLFTWEIGREADGRRWFYKRLERMNSDIPKCGWKKIGGSVYLVKEESTHKFEELLLDFEGPNVTWQKFRLKTEKT